MRKKGPGYSGLSFDPFDPEVLAKSHAKPAKEKKKRINGSPEKDFVQKELLPYLKSSGFCVNLAEARAVFDPRLQMYNKSMIAPGFPDIVGNYKDGLAVYIEAKAPGKRNTIRDVQIRFLTRKINSNAFAICTDSIEHFNETWKRFRLMSIDKRKDFLLDQFPQKRSI